MKYRNPSRILYLSACCALVACVDLKPRWEQYPDSGRPETAGDSTPPRPEPDAGDDGVRESDLPAPTPDSREPTPTPDAPTLEDLGPGRDVRADGGRTADSARDVRAETGSDGRAEAEDVKAPDAPPRQDAKPDSAPDIRDTRAPDLPVDSTSSPDTGISLAKLTGTAFGTGPAFSTNPTATHDKAFDGDITTFFDDSNISGGHTGIDIGGTAVARFLRYYPRLDFNDRMLGGTFQCSPSSQSSGYIDLFTVFEVPPLAWTTVSLDEAQSCRYFRYLGPAESYTNVGEIELWTKAEPGGSGGTTSDSFGKPWANLAYYQPVTASSEQTSTGKIAGNGNDGDISTVFCPANGGFPVWYRVDLGDAYPIRQTDITFETAAAAYQYQIDVSLDGSQWTTTAAHLSGVAGGRSTVADDFEAQARHVRVTITGVSNGKWGCIRELSVWSPFDSQSMQQRKRIQRRAP